MSERSTSKREKILSRVRALLAKADSTSFPDEAEACRLKADELMAAYAIEQWQLQAAAERDVRGGRPERRDLDWGWAIRTPFRDELVNLFHTILSHCRCVPVERKIDWAKQPLRIPVIGLPSDLDYADLLFTTLLMQLLLQLDPQPRPELPLADNIALLREAGLDWQQVAARLSTAGLLPEERFGHPGQDEAVHPYRSRYRRQEPNWYQRSAPKLAALYRAYCRRTQRPPFTLPSQKGAERYRQNFAAGFVGEVSLRLWRLEKRVAGDGDATALVLRDIHRANRAAVYEFFPELRPHAADCACDDCQEARERARRHEQRQRRRRKPDELDLYRRPRDHLDLGARRAGADAGREADIVSRAPRLEPRAAIGR